MASHIAAGSMYPPGFSRTADPSDRRFDISGLPPLLRTILVADGTVTKLLEAYFWEPIEVRVLAQGIECFDAFGLGPEDVIRRCVILASEARGRPLASANSTIALSPLEPRLRDGLLNEEMGIGALLRDRHLETYREQISVFSRLAEVSASGLQVLPGAHVVERTYRIHHNNRPLAEVTEVFPVEAYYSV
jgi:chorismate-pyruvate lyase